MCVGLLFLSFSFFLISCLPRIIMLIILMCAEEYFHFISFTRPVGQVHREYTQPDPSSTRLGQSHVPQCQTLITIPLNCIMHIWCNCRLNLYYINIILQKIFLFRTYSFVIVNSKTMKLPNDLLETVLPNKLFQEGVFVRGKCTGMTITEMLVLLIKFFNFYI